MLSANEEDMIFSLHQSDAAKKQANEDYKKFLQLRSQELCIGKS